MLKLFPLQKSYCIYEKFHLDRANHTHIHTHKLKGNFMDIITNILSTSYLPDTVLSTLYILLLLLLLKYVLKKNTQLTEEETEVWEG